MFVLSALSGLYRGDACLLVRRGLLMAGFLALFGAVAPASGQDALPEPASLILAGVSAAEASPQILAARRYAGFWDSGDEALARAALAETFIDETLPPGRPQGRTGPLQASATMRKAVPDMRCEIRQMVVAGDRVVLHLAFHGHFTGRFGEIDGHGQVVDFIATDIYQVTDGRIARNWHIEDNLTLLRQLGVLAG